MNAFTYLRPADAKGLWFMDNHVTVRVSRNDTPERVSVLEHRSPFNAAPPVHVHHDEDEMFHLLEGSVRFEVGLNTVVAHAGDTVVAPRGVPHGFRVISPEGVRMLTITRGEFEDMVRAVSRPALTDGPPPAEGPPSKELQALLAKLCSENGIDLLGPPID